MIMSHRSGSIVPDDIDGARTWTFVQRAAELLGHPPSPCEIHAIELWVTAWLRWRDRRTLQRHGFLFPPGSRGRADEDWQRFESWANGEPLPWYYADRFPFPPADRELSEEEVGAHLQEVLANLASAQVTIPKLSGPPRQAYRRLRARLLRRPLRSLATSRKQRRALAHAAQDRAAQDHLAITHRGPLDAFEKLRAVSNDRRPTGKPPRN